MELTVKRLTRSAESTIGEMYVNGVFECYTLEDAERATKIYGKTAIPKGRYEVIINWSQRFGQFMPLLLNVPQFEGIRIHAGNSPSATHGCLLVGKTKAVDFIGNSKEAYSALMQKLKFFYKREKIFITIE